jgi:hypothetical protein
MFNNMLPVFVHFITPGDASASGDEACSLGTDVRAFARTNVAHGFSSPGQTKDRTPCDWIDPI